MKPLNFFLACYVFVVTLSSCSERSRIAREFAEFTNKTIVLPSSFHKVISGKLMVESEVDSGLPVMIMYNDSLACSLCQINHLYERTPIYELSDSLGTFSVMTILSPMEEEYGEVVEGLIERDLDFPVYIDHSGDFRRLNSFIPEDTRFHCFLMDKTGKPIFVGDPVSSTALWDLFTQVLDSIRDSGQ